MKTTLLNAIEIEDQGGAIMASEWTTGSGNYIKKRPIPAHCEEMSIEVALKYAKGKTKQQVKRIVRAHPRCQKVICVSNRRALNKETKVTA